MVKWSDRKSLSWLSRSMLIMLPASSLSDTPDTLEWQDGTQYKYTWFRSEGSHRSYPLAYTTFSRFDLRTRVNHNKDVGQFPMSLPMSLLSKSICSLGDQGQNLDHLCTPLIGTGWGHIVTVLICFTGLSTKEIYFFKFWHILVLIWSDS